MSDFKLPDLGENIESGDVVSLLVSEGDTIQAQQDVIEIETDKAVIAVPSDVGGTVTKIHVARGQAVKPGQVILSLQPAAAGSAAHGQSIAGAGKETGRRSGEISRPGSESPRARETIAAARQPRLPACRRRALLPPRKQRPRRQKRVRRRRHHRRTMKMATRRRTLLNRVPTTIRKQWKPRPIRPTCNRHPLRRPARRCAD